MLKEYQSSADIDKLEIEKLRAELKVRRGGHNPARALESHEKNLIYVTGAEGSGSYWMTYHVGKLSDLTRSKKHPGGVLPASSVSP